jgi:hypothetical protein
MRHTLLTLLQLPGLLLPSPAARRHGLHPPYSEQGPDL